MIKTLTDKINTMQRLSSEQSLRQGYCWAHAARHGNFIRSNIWLGRQIQTLHWLGNWNTSQHLRDNLRVNSSKPKPVGLSPSQLHCQKTALGEPWQLPLRAWSHCFKPITPLRVFPKDRVHWAVYISLPSSNHLYPMELPSTRELELEMLLRQRETQLAELKVSNNYINKFCTAVLNNKSPFSVY